MEEFHISHDASRLIFCLLSAVETAFEGFEGDFQRPEFQDTAYPR